MQFNKLALAAAVAAVPATGMAMEPLNDAQLSSVTGQSGITIELDLPSVSMNVAIEDTDGITTGSGITGYDNPGMLYIQNQTISTPQPITVDIDVGSTSPNTGDTAMLLVNVDVPKVEMQTGDIYVVSGKTGSAVDLSYVAGLSPTGDPLLESNSITLKNLHLQIQLGDEATDFLTITTTSAISLTMGTLDNGTDDFVLHDADGGVISMDAQFIKNVDLSGDGGIVANVTSTGLALTVNTNSDSAGINMALMGVELGTNDGTDVLGNVYITGLQVNGTTVTVTGH